MTEPWLVIVALAAATLGVRLAGVLLGQRIPSHGPWTRGLNAMPGCLILSLVLIGLVGGGPAEWLAGLAAAAVAVATRSLPLTMVAGIAAIVALRAYG